MSAFPPKPQLGFLGAGWIGRHRLNALAAAGAADISALYDPNPKAMSEVRHDHPGVSLCSSLEELLHHSLDGLVIASPSGLHFQQAQLGLERGLAVFCQKPLGRNEREVSLLVDLAEQADRLLGVDFCYRETEAMQRIQEMIQAGEIGEVFSVDLVFHNAYGPDKHWYYNRREAGGGCLMDLGIHLLDLLCWVFPDFEPDGVARQLFSGAQPLEPEFSGVEDYALAFLRGKRGMAVHLACSWNLPAGRDALIECCFWGSKGGLRFRNTGGSFYDFQAEWLRGTETVVLTSPPDDWGGRAVCRWAEALAQGGSFQAQAGLYKKSARLLDRIYEPKSLAHAYSAP